MLKLKKGVPLDYSLCCRTVTVYRREDLSRRVFPNAYYDVRSKESVDGGIGEGRTEFLLIIPGDADIRLGDKIVPGEHPALENEAGWLALNEAAMPELGVAANVSRKFWQGAVCHVEAR